MREPNSCNSVGVSVQVAEALGASRSGSFLLRSRSKPRPSAEPIAERLLTMLRWTRTVRFFRVVEPVFFTTPENVMVFLVSAKFGICGETWPIPTSTGWASERAAAAWALPGSRLTAPTNSAKAERARRTRLVT